MPQRFHLVIVSRCPTDNIAATKALNNVECIKAEKVSALPRISLMLSPSPEENIK